MVGPPSLSVLSLAVALSLLPRLDTSGPGAREMVPPESVPFTELSLGSKLGSMDESSPYGEESEELSYDEP